MAKRPTYVRDGLSLILVGVLVWALTPIAGYRQYALPGLLVGLVLGVLVIVFGYRSARRAELLGFLFESVGPLLAVPGRGNPIRVSGWTLGWPTGRPKKIRMKFGTGQVKLADEDSPMGGRPTASAAALGDKRWAGELAKRTAAVVGGYYKVAKSDPMRHTLILKLSDPPADTSTQESAPVMRAKKIANELLAGTASFGKVETDPESGEVTRLEVAHEVGSKLAAAGYRTRVERTVSVMLPGRWRARWDMEGDRVTFEVRPHLPDSLWIPPLEIPEGLDPLKDYREVRIPYGVDEDGEVISWRPAVVPQFLLTGGTGSGKRLALSTPIPTPSGWTTMGDLEEGDLVLGRDGKPCQVETLWAVEEQPDLYRVQFSDGQFVLADAEHQWLVSSRSARRAVNRPKRRTAIENHRRAWKQAEELERLASTVGPVDVTLRDLLEFVTRHLPDAPWTKPMGFRTALEAVDCPFRLETRLIPRTTGDFARPARVYDLATALKGLAVRLAESHHTPPAGEVSEIRMTTAEMLAGGVRVGSGRHANFAVRVTAPLDLPPAQLAVDPYVMGAWLGDGTSSSGGFTGIDPEVLAQIRAAGFDTHSHAAIAQAHYIRGLVPLLRGEGVLNNKHIPAAYLRGSIDQRIALLQGLMDTDGTIDVAGCCELSLSDPRLAAQALDLIRTLGIKASLTTASSSYRDEDGELIACRDRHRIHFTTALPVFRLTRKLQRLPDETRATSEWIYITSIEPVDPEPARCITVDSTDRTFLCGTGYLPTSNTSTGHGILAQMTQFGWPVWVADGKGIEFLAFQDWPNVQIVASTIQQQIAVIHRAWALMEYRYDLVQKRQARTEDFEPLLLFIDEFTDMKANLLAWYPEVKEKSAPRQPRTFEEIGSIARKGRTARVHMVLAMQRPDASILTGEVRENFGQRMSMGPLSPQAAEMMWANQVTGVALPRGKTGRATSFNAAGVPVEMQAYRVPDPGGETPGTPEYELLEKLRPAEVRHERMLIVPPEIDWSEDGDPIPVGFSDYQKAEWVWAKDRPDLDPLEQLAAAGAGGVRSSAAAMFGLDGKGPALPDPSPISVSSGAGGDEDYLEDEQQLLDDYAASDVLEGYSSPTPTPVSTLSVGDLIRVDEETEAWAVVEEEPVEDFDNPESLVISWRDDMDESGQLIVSASAFVLARKPQGEW